MNADLTFMSEDVVVKKGDDEFPFSCKPVTFNQTVIDEKVNLEGEKQAFVFKKADLITAITKIVPGVQILRGDDVYEVIRGKGNYYDNDPYGIEVVLQCIKRS
jgi:hypothetical protein